MKTLLAMNAMLVLALSMNVRADDASAAQTPQVSTEEQSDFALLTPISEAQSAEVRGEGRFVCTASYAAQVASAIQAAQCFLASYRMLNGHPDGVIMRNPDLTWSYTGNCGN